MYNAAHSAPVAANNENGETTDDDKGCSAAAQAAPSRQGFIALLTLTLAAGGRRR